MSKTLNWKNFGPKITPSDKRDRESMVTKGHKLVEKSFNELGLGIFAAIPLVDKDRNILSVKAIYPPLSPLEEFWTSDVNKSFVLSFVKALEDTQLFALDLWDLKEDDEKNGENSFNERVGVQAVDDHTVDEVPKPEKPVFSMTKEGISVYFGTLLKYCYTRENISKFKLWVKKNKKGEIIETATPLKIYDEKAENIMARAEFWGRGSGGPNIANKLKMVSAYLLSRLGHDHNVFCEEIPPLYKPLDVDFDRPEENDDMFKGPIRVKPTSRLMKAKLAFSKQSNKPCSSSQSVTYPTTPPSKRKRIDTVSSPESDIEDDEVNISQAPMSRMITPAIRNDHPYAAESPGTPAYSDSENISDDGVESDPHINKNIDQVCEGNVKKAHAGGITTVNIADVKVCPFNGYYRASISDGADLSDKVIFDTKLNDRIEKELLGEAKVSIVRLDQVNIFQKCIVGVVDYVKLGDGPLHVGEARYLGAAFYRGLQPRGVLTPSCMRKHKLFK